jgi:hypothetical protein
MRRAPACVVGIFGLVAACGQGSGAPTFVENPGSSDTSDGGASDSSAPVTTSGCAPASTTPCTPDAATAALPAPDAAIPATCGDGVCVSSETCTNCPSDCGQCPSCGLAPSCSVGVALPSQPTTLDFNELSAPISEADGGAEGGALEPSSSPSCGAAQLRMRISRIEVQHQGQMVWLPTGTISGPAESYYCIVQASDGVEISGSGPDASTNGTLEVALTTPTAQIPDFGGADFAPSDSIFWGEAGPRVTQGNLTITYSCFQQKSSGSSTWSNVLGAAATAAGSLASAGPYGWAFGLGSVGLSVAAAAASAAEQQGDWHMFDVTQTIDASWFLELTNGRTWSFSQGGGNAAFQYPWGITVYVESWGCADAIATTK